MEEYKPNSDKYREASQKQEKIVDGLATKRKRSKLNQLLSMIVADNVTNILSDVLIPAGKRMLLDSLSMLLGEEPRRSKNARPGSKVNYRGAYEERQKAPERVPSSFQYEEVDFEERGDAELILDKMFDLLQDQGYVAVANFYEMAGVESEWVDWSYGWTSLAGAKVVTTRGGEYYIRFPNVRPLRRN